MVGSAAKRQEKDFIREFTAEQVQIIVGPEDNNAVFHVSKKVFTDASPFFTASFSGQFKEAKEGILRLPEEDPVTFSWIAKGIYGNSFHFCDSQEASLLLFAKIEVAVDKYRLDTLKIALQELRKWNLIHWYGTSMEDLSFILRHCATTSEAYTRAINLACDYIHIDAMNVKNFEKSFIERAEVGMDIARELAKRIKTIEKERPKKTKKS